MTESERIVIGATIRNNYNYDELKLLPEEFASTGAKQIWEGIGAIMNRGMEVDLVTLYEELPGVESSFLAELTNLTIGNLEYHAEKIRERGRKMRLNNLQMQIYSGLREKQTKSGDIIAIIDRELSAIAEQKISKSRWIKAGLMTAVDDLEQRSLAPGRIIGVPSGYESFDSMTAGFQRGEYYVIAARPGIGKTSLALCMTARQAIRYARTVGFFSCEMSFTLIVQRLLAITGGFDLQKIRRGYPKKTDYALMTNGAGRLYNSKILINDTPNIPLSDLRMESRMMRRRGVEIIYVDYLTLIRHDDRRKPKHEQIGEVSKGLKNLARELNMPIVALSQVRRNAEGVAPNLADLRQSGEIEEDADLVMFLDRKRDEAETKVNVAKNRNGPIGDFKLIFAKKQTRFDEEENETN